MNKDTKDEHWPAWIRTSTEAMTTPDRKRCHTNADLATRYFTDHDPVPAPSEALPYCK
jgi:hypothetical protein